MGPNSLAKPVAVHRGPRRWRPLSSETFVLPLPSAPSVPSSSTLIVSALGLVGLVVSALVYGAVGGGASGGLIIGFLAISGLTMVGSLVTYFVQANTARAEAARQAQGYRQHLDKTTGRLAELATVEVTARNENDPPLGVLLDQLYQQPGVIWRRRPGDPDFLAVRIGVGDAPPRFHVRTTDQGAALTLPPKDPVFAKLHADTAQVVAFYRSLHGVPITVPIAEHPAIALVSNSPDTARPSAVARIIAAQVAFHHSPTEVHLVILAPERRYDDWSWAATLPYTSGHLPALGIRQEDRARALSQLLAELVRRENALEATAYDRQREPPLPRLVIVVDEFLPPDGESPLASPALALALRRGAELGAAVITVGAGQAQAPAQATLLVETQYMSATLTTLRPDPPAPGAAQLDAPTRDDFTRLGQHLRLYRPEEETGLVMPSQVELLPLLTPPIADPGIYDVRRQWQEGPRAQARHTRPGGKAAFTIPLGRKIGLEPLYLDFVNDGPHGLLIGQTGSGKSELLRSLVAALAAQYPPDQVNFVLVDYKAGLALEPFADLPHTVAFLTNMSQAGQTSRFLKMLEAEVLRRQRARDAGTPVARLFVVIDEFAEMVNRKVPNDNADAIIDNLLSIVRLGRELDIHLLFAAQRPEGSVIQRLRGYVQYRVCLRTNTEEDSREVLGRTDAAALPAGVPGRGYLLRGDNELELFQAARVAVPYTKDRPAPGKRRRTVDRVLVDRMRELAIPVGIKRWPTALPTPSFESPTPLVLVASEPRKPGIQSWDPARNAHLRPMMLPIGLFDRPIEQKQAWCAADLVGYQGRLTGGPVLVMGDLNAGKTTTLQTVLLHAATTASADDLRWYVLDPNGALVDFAALPHAADFLESGQSNHIDANDDKALAALKSRFERALRLERRPRLLLVVDDYDDLRTRMTDKKLLDELAFLAIRGRDRQVYLAVSASRPSYEGLPQTLINHFATRVVLYMSDKDQMRAVLGGRLPFMPDAIPGRGFIQTRRTLDEVQVAAPVDGENDEERSARLQALIAARAGQNARDGGAGATGHSVSDPGRTGPDVSAPNLSSLGVSGTGLSGASTPDPGAD